MSEATPYTLDARRYLCPMPVIKTQEFIKGLEPGDRLEVTCTDPGVLSDIPSWCRIHGHEVLSSETQGREFILLIQVR